MAVTYGFYDSLNHDRLYNAQQMSAIFDGIINDGVFMSVGNQFHTVAGTGMQIIVKSGRAWFDSTWTLNDAEYPLSIDTADVLLTRIDAVVLEVNSEVATRANTIKVVKGTPASTPAKPTLTNTATIHQHALAYVTVAKNTTAITNSMIEIVVGKTETPYVTAILQTTDITDLFKKWENDFQVWFETVKGTLDGDVALNLQNQIDHCVKKADKATSADIEAGVADKWIDSAYIKQAAKPIGDISTVLDDRIVDEHYLLCDGRIISRTAYPEYYKYVAYKVASKKTVRLTPATSDGRPMNVRCLTSMDGKYAIMYYPYSTYSSYVCLCYNLETKQYTRANRTKDAVYIGIHNNVAYWMEYDGQCYSMTFGNSTVNALNKINYNDDSRKSILVEHNNRHTLWLEYLPSSAANKNKNTTIAFCEFDYAKNKMVITDSSYSFNAIAKMIYFENKLFLKTSYYTSSDEKIIHYYIYDIINKTTNTFNDSGEYAPIYKILSNSREDLAQISQPHDNDVYVYERENTNTIIKIYKDIDGSIKTLSIPFYAKYSVLTDYNSNNIIDKNGFPFMSINYIGSCKILGGVFSAPEKCKIGITSFTDNGIYMSEYSYYDGISRTSTSLCAPGSSLIGGCFGEDVNISFINILDDFNLPRSPYKYIKVV